jgi:RNA polymerase sigma-70 factor (ECF subfamily)
MAREGVPANPRAWLVSAGPLQGHRQHRRQSRFEALDEERAESLAADETVADEIEDDRLRLIFTCCHPALAPDAQWR